MVEVGAETRLYALFGAPVAHSLSPAMQTAAFRALGVDAVYLAFEVARERLPDAVRAMRALRFPGANVTLPHKEAVFALLDAHTPQAAAIGAVNTLYWDGEKLVGDNTDAEGFVRSLEEAVGNFPTRRGRRSSSGLEVRRRPWRSAFCGGACAASSSRAVGRSVLTALRNACGARGRRSGCSPGSGATTSSALRNRGRSSSTGRPWACTPT